MAEAAQTTELVVKSWIEWTRQNVNITEGYPKVTSLAIVGHPWETDPELISKFENEGVRREHLGAFTDAIAPDLAAFAPRFTALHYYHSLLSEAKDLLADPRSAALWGYYDDADLESLKSAVVCLKDDLALLVRTLPAEECPTDWRFFRWEILNSFLISDWERALKLYNRAQELQLLEASEVQVFRGQFRFLVVYFTAIAPTTEGLETLAFEPVIYGLPQHKLDRSIAEALADLLKGAEDKFNSLPLSQRDEAMSFLYQVVNDRMLFPLGLVGTETESEFPDRERDWLHDASVDLEKALLKRMDLPSVYRSMLAKCFFLTGHFHDAAKQYESLVHTDPSVDVYKSLALTYRRAGEPQKA